MAKFNCVIVDPDMNSRMRLKQATTPIAEFGSVMPLSSFLEASGHLNGEREIHVVFVSARFASNDLQQFITQARQSKQGQDSAYVIVLKSSQEGNSEVSGAMMLGGDGVLCEPYSVDSLLEITLLAARVRKERSDARERIAINMIVKDLISQLDLVACLKANDCELGLSIKKLKDLGEVIKGMTPESRVIYYEMCEKAFIDAPLPPRALAVKKYGGVSSRVKKKMDAKIASDITKQQGRS